jgi:AraC-like DNA-binding protein
MLDEMGLPRACLDEPDMRVSLPAMAELLERSAAESGLEDFGLRMAEFRPFSTNGVLGLVVREQPTIRKALEAAQQYFHLTSDAVFIRMTEAGDLMIVSLGMNVGKRAPSRQLRELGVANVCSTLRALAGKDWRPKAVCFSHTPPADLAIHHRLFGRIVEFGHEFDGFVMARADADAPVPGADPAMARQMERYIEHLGGGGEASPVETVRERILTLLPRGDCSADRVALHLGVDRRTIHRRLAAEGLTFSQLLQEVRCEYAAHYMTGSRRSLADVAGLLGFSAQSAFTRWFRASFGCTPSAWRAANGRERAPAA